MARSSILRDRACAQCGTRPIAGYKYCSKQCGFTAADRRKSKRPLAEVNAERAAKKAARIARICEWCGKPFARKPGGKAYRGQSNEGRFCSYACTGHAKREGRFSPVYCGWCEACQKPFARRGTKAAKTCSPECMKRQAKERCEAKRPALVERLCVGCGSVFSYVYGTKARICSEACRKARQSQSRRRMKERYGHKYRDRARAAGVPYEPISALAILERDGWRCQICGRKTPKRHRGKFRDDAPELDHRVPMALGGGHTWENCQCACRRCNLDKSGTLVRGQLRLASR